MQAALVAALLVLGFGCAQPRVPAWAIHVPRRNVQAAPRTEEYKAALQLELESTADPDDSFLTPELIAALAVGELQAGNPWDAAVLLAIASHRRNQQADYIDTFAHGVGRRRAEEAVGYLDYDRYAEYVKVEVATFRGAKFDDELRRVSTHLGGTVERDDYMNDWMRVAMGNLNDRHATEQIIGERIKQLAEPQPERLAHPELAEAFRQRLVVDANVPALNRMAVQYLAWVPLHAFRISALEAVLSPFDGSLIRAGVIMHREERQLIVSSLRDPIASVRGHAALILGVVEDLPAITEIESAMADEQDPYVQRMFEYALIRLGNHEHLDSLVQGLRLRDVNTVIHAVILLHWLNPDVKTSIPMDAVIDALNTVQEHAFGRFMAAMLMCGVAQVKGLPPEASVRLLSAVGAIERTPEAETGAELLSTSFAAIESIERAEVLRAIARGGASRQPWLARLSKVVTKADVAMLDELLAEQKEPANQRWLIAAAAGIPGLAGQELLERWFAREEALRISIAVQLVLRADVDKTRLAQLSERFDDDVSTTLLDSVLGRAGVGARLAGYLRSDDPRERAVAMLVAKLVGGPEHRAALWATVNYYDDRYYPDDVRLRQLALSALVDINLNRNRAPLKQLELARE